MAVIGIQLGLAHPFQTELLAGFMQARRRRVFRNVTRIEEIYPLLQRYFRPSVEVVHLQDIVFRVKVAHRADLELLLLEGGQTQKLAVVDALELRLPVIDHVRAVAQIEIHDVHAVYLPDMLVPFPAVDVFRHELRRAEQHPLEIGELRVVLHLDDEQLATVVFRQQVHTVLLVVFVLLVALALQQFLYLDRLVQQRGEQPLQHAEVGLVAQQALHRPIETDKLLHHSTFF